MLFASLLSAFQANDELPVPVDQVISWVRANTDYKIIKLHGVNRKFPAFRGILRRRSVPCGALYSGEYEIHTDILFAKDLSPEWKRLVICKELLHVFDPPEALVDTAAKVRQLVPAMAVTGAPAFYPALHDKFGVMRALAVLVPEAQRVMLLAAVESGDRSVAEVAALVQLPEAYVDFWLRSGAEVTVLLNK